MERPLVTVIIVHHRGEEILRKCLDSLFKTKYDNFKVVLVDNGSRDGSTDYIKKVYGDFVDIIRSDVNLGFVGGNNLALKRINSKYVVLLNDDTVVDPNWLNYLVEIAEKDPLIGACQPKLLAMLNSKYFEYNGAAGGFLDLWCIPLTRGRIFDIAEEDKGQYDRIVECFWASGAALFLRVKALHDVGLLDDFFYAHMEEIDLCWRLKLLGYKVVSVPNSIVYHLGGGTSLGNVFFFKHRNNLVMMLKNYSALSILKYFPVRMIFDALSFLYYLKKDITRSLSVIKAYFSLLKNLRIIIKKRYVVQRKRKIKDSEIIKDMVKKSIVIQYYLLGRKFFYELQGLPLELKYYLADGLRRIYV